MIKATLKEQYCIKNGWEKVRGYKVNVQIGDDDFDYYFVDDADVKLCYYWRDKEGDNEQGYEHDEIDDLIEYIDDYKDEGEELFNDFVKNCKLKKRQNG